MKRIRIDTDQTDARAFIEKPLSRLRTMGQKRFTATARQLLSVPTPGSL